MWRQRMASPRSLLLGQGGMGPGSVRRCANEAVDYNPELVRASRATGHQVLYGDAEDPEFMASLPLARAQWLVSTMREDHVSRVLIHSLRAAGFAGRIALTAHGPAEVPRLEHAGADLVLLPFADAAREAADRLLEPQQVVMR